LHARASKQRLVSARLDSRFIAMLFAIYDAATGKITLANAGGPYPLLVRNGQVRAIRLEGVPLGLIPDTQYDETTIDVLPGDVVILASDGILESENAAREEFGPERLTSLLSAISLGDSARQIAERILAATDGHSGSDIAPHDDRTLVVLRVTDDYFSDFFRNSRLSIIAARRLPLLYALEIGSGADQRWFGALAAAGIHLQQFWILQQRQPFLAQGGELRQVFLRDWIRRRQAEFFEILYGPFAECGSRDAARWKVRCSRPARWSCRFHVLAVAHESMVTSASTSSRNR